MKGEGLTKKEVKKILEFPILNIVNLLLLTVNLKDKEREIIKNVDILGKSQEEVANLMNCSTKNIYNNREKALKKIGLALKDNKIALQILENDI